MANTLLTIGMITRETLMVLENELTFTKQVSREYDDRFGVEGAKIGSVLNVRYPVRFTNTTGQGLQLQDVTETSVPVTLTTQYQRSFIFSSSDLKLSIDDFSKRFVKPAVASMANQIDFDGLGQYLNIYNMVGSPGTVPASTLVYLQAGQRLDEEACPRDDERCFVISPAMHATAVDTVKGLFNPQALISDYAEKGLIAKFFLGGDWYMDQNTRSQTFGPLGGTPLVNLGSQTGASINTDGWTGTSKKLSRGDVISFTGVNAVNPQSFQDTGSLRQFVVTADCSDAGGAIAIPISPAIVTSGPFQNVTGSPADNAPVITYAAGSTVSPQGLLFHPQAFTFANADLPLPGGVDMADRVASKQVGLSIRLVRAYDINTDRFPLRTDLLGGWATLYPQFAVRVAS